MTRKEVVTGCLKATVLLALALVLGLGNIGAYPGGAGDGSKEYSCGSSCHTTAGTGTNTMSASNMTPAPGAMVVVRVEVAEKTVSSLKKVGVVLAKSLTATPGTPDKDGWKIVVDPNTNSEPSSYNEKTVDAAGKAVFEWVMKAPSTAGKYKLFARLYHGGGSAFVEDNTTGLEFDVGGGGPVGEGPKISAAFPSFVNVSQPANITANVKSTKEVVTVQVFYTFGGVRSHNNVMDMTIVSGTRTDGNWKAALPAQDTPGNITFHIAASDGTANSTFPASGEAFIEVREPVFLSIGRVDIPFAVYTLVPIAVRASVSDTMPVRSVSVHYTEPLSQVEAVAGMALESGNATNGTWGVVLPGPRNAGALSLYITASNGKTTVSAPAEGNLTMKVEPWKAPKIVSATVPPFAFVGKEAEIRAKVASEDGVSTVSLRYTVRNDTPPLVTPMALVSGSVVEGDWAGTIPPQGEEGTVQVEVAVSDGIYNVTSPAYAVAVKLEDIALVHTPATLLPMSNDTVITANAKNARAVYLTYMGVEAGYNVTVEMKPGGLTAEGYTTYTGVIPHQGRPGALTYWLNATNGTRFTTSKPYTASVAGTIDLYPVAASLSTHTPYVHKELTINVTIRNGGDMEARNVRVGFYDDFYYVDSSKYMGFISNISVKPGATVNVSLWYLPPGTDRHPIRVSVDPYDVVPETNETNNEMVMNITAAAYPEQFPVMPSREELINLWPQGSAVIAGVTVISVLYARRRKSGKGAGAVEMTSVDDLFEAGRAGGKNGRRRER